MYARDRLKSRPKLYEHTSPLLFSVVSGLLSLVSFLHPSRGLSSDRLLPGCRSSLSACVLWMHEDVVQARFRGVLHVKEGEIRT